MKSASIGPGATQHQSFTYSFLFFLPSMSNVPANALRGSELLATINQLGESASKRELCEATGYITTDQSGKTKMLYNAMLSEMLVAKGVSLPNSKAGGGPTPSYSTSTLTNGQVVVGKCYAGLLGANHGDSWSIKVDQAARSITLILKD